MKKVVFSVIKAGRNENRMSGVGYITDKDLLIPAISRNGKAYIRVFEDCIRYCHKMPNGNNEFKGTFYELKEIEFETRNGSGYETREIEITNPEWSIQEIKIKIEYEKLWKGCPFKDDLS